MKPEDLVSLNLSKATLDGVREHQPLRAKLSLPCQLSKL